MIRRPPRSTRTDTLFPYTTLFRSPQVATNSGAVEAKVAVPDANEFKAMAPDPDLVAFAGQDGALYYTDAQRLSNQSRIVQDFQQARSEEHTSELQSLMRISYAVFCLKKKKKYTTLSNILIKI